MTGRILSRGSSRLWGAVAVAGIGAAGLFAWQLVAASLPSVSFQAGVPAEVGVRTLTGREGAVTTLVRPRIDGEHVGWFALDSGASALVIDAAHADSLGLTRLVSVQVSNCGTRGNLVRASSFELGPVTIRHPILAAVDLSPLNEVVKETLGEGLAGTVGYSLFAGAVVEIRYDDERRRDRVLLHEPGSFSLDRGWWRPLEIVERTPAHPSRFNAGRRARIALDTGKSGGVSFYAGYVGRESLLEGREVRKAPNATVCGRTWEMEGRLERFELAGVRFHRPLARFKIPGTFNAGDDEDLAGTIGRSFLERFTVIFDYPGRRVAFLQSRGPSPFPPVEPGEHFPGDSLRR